MLLVLLALVLTSGCRAKRQAARATALARTPTAVAQAPTETAQPGPSPSPVAAPVEAPAAGEAILFQDDFQDGRADDTWQVQGAWTVQQDGERYTFDASGQGLAWVQGGGEWTDYAYRAVVRLSAGSASLIFRGSRQGRYELRFTPRGTSLRRQPAAVVATTLAESDLVLATGRWHKVAIVARGGQFIVRVDDAPALSATDDDPLLAGTVGVLARILFHVTEPGASAVRFLEGSKLDERPIPPFGPKPIPAQWQGGLLIGRDCIPGQAGQGQIDGRVILQARRNHRGAVVRAAPWPHPQITGADGTYSFAPLSSGTYSMVITHTGYLRTEPLTVTVTAGQPISVPTAILLGGDVNSDDKISFVDAVIISRAFTYARGEQGYVLAADIDADGVVDLDDLVLVGANWQCTVLDTTPRCRRWRD